MRVGECVEYFPTINSLEKSAWLHDVIPGDIFHRMTRCGIYCGIIPHDMFPKHLRDWRAGNVKVPNLNGASIWFRAKEVRFTCSAWYSHQDKFVRSVLRGPIVSQRFDNRWPLISSLTVSFQMRAPTNEARGRPRE